MLLTIAHIYFYLFIYFNSSIYYAVYEHSPQFYFYLVCDFTSAISSSVHIFLFDSGQGALQGKKTKQKNYHKMIREIADGQ